MEAAFPMEKKDDYFAPRLYHLFMLKVPRSKCEVHRDGYKINVYMFGEFLLTSAHSKDGYLNQEKPLDKKKDDI